MFNKAQLRTVIGLTLFLVVLGAQPAQSQRPYNTWDNTKQANWSQIFYDFEREFEFGDVNGLSRCTWAAAGHLGHNNQEAFEYRKKLGPSDWADADGVVSDTLVYRMEPGSALLDAAIMVVRGDYVTAWRFAERGVSEINYLSDSAAIANMSQQEVATAIAINEGLMGMAAVAGYLYGEPIPDKDDLASAYAQVGEVSRLTEDIQKLAKEILDTDLVASDTATPSPADDSMDNAVRAMMDESVKQAKHNHLIYMDTLFQMASPLRNAFFSYNWGNLLTKLGREDDALRHYYDAMDSDGDCDLFRRIYIEKAGARDGYDEVLKHMKKVPEEPDPPVNALLYVSECYIGQGKPDKAISEDTKFLKKSPGNLFALSQRARAYQAKGDVVHAVEDARAVVAADSMNYDGWFVLGLTAKANADPLAKEYLAKAVSCAPEGLSIGNKAQEALK